MYQAQHNTHQDAPLVRAKPSIRTVLKSAPNKQGDTVEFARHSQGYEVAGSGTRWTNTKYSVMAWNGQYYYGHSYGDLASAMGRFEYVTGMGA